MSASQHRKEGENKSPPKIGTEGKITRWLRCVERPSRDHPDYDLWIKRCPHCQKPNPGIRLHCSRCRKIWE